MRPRTVGVEEEFLLIDPVDGQPRAIAAAVLDAAQEPHADEVEAELQLQQIETGTEPCRSLDELGRQVRVARHRASEAARSMGVEIVALGTSPLPVRAELTPSSRYRRMAERFGMTADEQLTCGCHVHVGVDSEDEAVAVLDRIRPWLAPLLAISANSPFWQGHDSRYASYRSQVWARWPSAGATELFGSPSAYHETVRAMTNSGTLLDQGMIYFDARMSQRYSTVEIRVADVCLHTDDTVLLAALVRALVETAAREWAADQPPNPIRTELLRLATWRAARFGLDTDLIDPCSQRTARAQTVLDGLIAYVRKALEDTHDYTALCQLREGLIGRGNGAQVQRRTYARSGRLEDVVTDSVRLTLEP